MKTINRIAPPNYIGLGKGNERYVIAFDSGREAEVYSVIRRWANDTNLSLTIQDAVKLCKQVRNP